jgi:hypothetical protein
MASTRRSDLGAALTGLILGGVVLFGLMFSIVHMTNSHYNSKEAAAEHKK